MRIEQCGDNSFRFEVNKLNGVSYITISKDKGLYMWKIDEEIFSLVNLKNKLEQLYPKDVKEFEENLIKYLEPKEIDFDELSKHIKDNGYKSKREYIVIGDVTEYKKYENYSTFTLVFDNNAFKTLKVKIENKYISNEYSLKNMKEQKEVKIIGFIEVDNLQFLMKPTKKIEIIGESKRIKQIKQWNEEIQNQALEKQQTFYSLPERIGLITNRNSKGCKDFKKILGKNYYDEYIGTRLKDVSLKADNIIKAIQEFNEEKSCDCIFIVSGGGDPYWLLNFSNIELLKAISNSKIPIFTGIAHSDDELLCDKISSLSFETPSKAADHIPKLINKENKDEIKRMYAKNKKEKNNEIENLKIEIQQKDEEIQELKDKIEDKKKEIQKLNDTILKKDKEFQETKNDLEQAQNDLEQEKSKGFLKRLFRI